MPYGLERADKLWAERIENRFGTPSPPAEEYMPRVYGCIFDDEIGLRNRDVIGMEQIWFETDYPHADTTFPHSKETAQLICDKAGLDDREPYLFLRGQRDQGVRPAALRYHRVARLAARLARLAVALPAAPTRRVEGAPPGVLGLEGEGAGERGLAAQVEPHDLRHRAGGMSAASCGRRRESSWATTWLTKPICSASSAETKLPVIDISAALRMADRPREERGEAPGGDHTEPGVRVGEAGPLGRDDERGLERHLEPPRDAGPLTAQMTGLVIDRNALPGLNAN